MASFDPAQLLAAAQLHEAEGRLAAADAAYQRVLTLAPAHPDILRALGLIAHRRGRADAARRYIERSIAARPRAETALILAGLHLAQKQYGAAAASCARAADLAPGDAAPWLELAGVHTAAEDFGAAEAALRRALAIQPGLADAQAGLGSVLFSQGRFEAAAAACRALLAAHPAHAGGWRNLGAAERALGHFAASRAAYVAAIRCAPDYAEAHRDLGLLDLLLGRAEEGFAEYEWRWRAEEIGAPLLATPRWDGGDGTGKTILLQWEQGFGDTIQCLRFVPMVAARFGTVLLRLPPGLEKLAGCLTGFARVVSDTERAPRHDVHAYVLSLPFLLGLNGPGGEAGAPYLAAPNAAAAVWRDRLAADGAAGKRVGLCWFGNPAQINDKRRSMAAACLAPLLGAPGCVFYCLHPDIEPPEGVRRLPARLANFAETAAAIVNLDLVISVDTAVAHLTGALGGPLWVPLAAVPDWRWGLEAGTTPWYRSARLYRQDAAGDWAGVMGRVRADLDAWVEAGSGALERSRPCHRAAGMVRSAQTTPDPDP